MKTHIITGMSGAGKSLMKKVVEDSGYYCVDNLPPRLLAQFLRMYNETKMESDIAVVIDIRGREFLEDFLPALKKLEEFKLDYDVIFLEANNKNLIKRYKETRRQHPLETESNNIVDAIEEERERLEKIKRKANYIIDSSDLLPKELRAQLVNIINKEGSVEKITLNMVSFGFKYGAPLDCDMVFDVRFIDNPYYIPAMKKMTGLNSTVKKYVLTKSETVTFIEKVTDLIEFLIPNFIKEGKTQLVIGIGCTGGRHRSVAITNELTRILLDKSHRVISKHRDLSKDGKH